MTNNPKPPRRPHPGRPKAEKGERRVQITVSLSQSVSDWFRNQPEPAGRIIERLLAQSGEMK